MYLFLFSALLLIFQYVNSKNIFNSYENDLGKLKNKTKTLNEKLTLLQNENLELTHFSIENNEEALTYFENQGFETETLVQKISDDLLDKNIYEGVDHPIIPYVSMTDSKILINQIKVLNHKWILANFTDGKHWGELFISYTVEPNETINYTLVDYFLYPKYDL